MEKSDKSQSDSETLQPDYRRRRGRGRCLGTAPVARHGRAALRVLVARRIERGRTVDRHNFADSSSSLTDKALLRVGFSTGQLDLTIHFPDC
jgi:hypothetical protein